MIDLADENWLGNFVTASQRFHFPAGEVIHRAGDHFSRIHLVISGQVEIWHTSSDGKEVWLGTVSTGDVFGAKLSGTEDLSGYDWVALKNVTILSITPSAFDTLSLSQPDMSRALYQRMSTLLDKTRRAFVLAQTANAKGRICHELLRLSTEIGRAPDKRVIRPNPVFADMARRANTTRETVSRTVSQLCKSGILSREPGALVLNEPERLLAS